MRTFLNVIFIILSVITILEFFFVCGTFTGPLMMVLVGIAGISNVIYSAINKQINEAILYAICTIALSMGYLKIML